MKFLILCLIFCGLAAFGETLEDLDRIVAKADGLDAFLASPALVDEYYAALHGYYGGKFNRAAFDVILLQLRAMKDKVPALKSRLWETTSLGKEITIETAIKTYGRSLDQAAWNSFYQGRLADWDARAARLTPADVVRTSAELRDEIAKFEAGGPGKVQRAEFFSGLRAKPEYRAAAAAILRDYFRAEEVVDKLNGGDADLILDTLNTFRNGELGPLATFLKDEIPTLPQLLDNEKMFPREMRLTKAGKTVPVGSGGKAVYRFVPIPRRIHGIWKGIPLGECVGGGQCDKVTAERWATIALKDTQLHHLEKDRVLEDGSHAPTYLGFVQQVPLKKGRDVIASVDIGAQIMRNKIVIANAKTGENENTSLFALWLDRTTAEMPKGWKGVAIGQSNAINNANVLPTVRSSPAYLLGENLGDAKEWKPLDEIGGSIAKNSAPAAYSYGGDMIYDARDRSSGLLTLLDPKQKALVEGPEEIERVLRVGTWEQKLRLVKALQNASWLPEATRLFMTTSEHYRLLTQIVEARQTLDDFRRTVTRRERPRQRVNFFVACVLNLAIGVLTTANADSPLKFVFGAGLSVIGAHLMVPEWRRTFARRMRDVIPHISRSLGLEAMERQLTRGEALTPQRPSRCRVLLRALRY